MPDHEHLLLISSYGVQERDEISDHVEICVARRVGRRVRVALAAQVRRHGSVAKRGQGLDLVPPGVPELGEAVEQQDHRALTFLGYVHVDAVDFDRLVLYSLHLFLVVGLSFECEMESDDI